MATLLQRENPAETKPVFGEGICVPKAIAARAARIPDHIALTMAGEVLRYRDLDCRANRVARCLRSLGVGSDVLVGLCLPRSLDMVVAALGILKSGGAYLPLDPAYPEDRLAYLLDDAQVPVLITNAAMAGNLSGVATRILAIDGPEIAESADHLPRVDVMGSDLAYTIYTSGSTGRPKGVEITHSGLANLVAWHRQAFAVTASDRASHLAGLGFDAAVWELWPYLTAGASVHLVDDSTRRSPELLRDWLVAQKITIGFVPTPMAERMLFLDWPPETALRIMLTGGDTLHHFPSPDLPFQLINNYGPTECTVVATSGPVPAQGHSDILPSIGKPIANTRIYLLSEQFEQVPQGTSGEIYIESVGLARGYRRAPELTVEKFIPNPFRPQSGSRLYRTGDLARRLPDGQLAFMGRADDQIKVRGYRIEPREIVSLLNQQPGVYDSLVISRPDALGEKQLVAYLVAGSDFKLPYAELRDRLRKNLPEYMVPSWIVPVTEFPVTSNGKIDLAALPEPDFTNVLQEQVPEHPRTATEERVAQIISQLLKVADVGVDDDFFMMGGHSLLGVQLIARLRETFGVQLSVRILFETPTVAELALEIDCLVTKAQPEPHAQVVQLS